MAWNKGIVIKLVIALVLAAVGLFGWFGRPEVERPRASGVLRQEVFVWQRVWSDDHAEAVAWFEENFRENFRGRGRFASLLVLAAEVDLKRGEAAIADLDAAVLGVGGQTVGLVVRVEPWAGPFEAEDAVVDVAAEALRRARAAGLDVAELQIDFDCGEKKLDGYRVWIEAIRQRVRDTPVTITALPAWLDRRACGRLVRATDGFVLQVHSLTAPKRWEDPVTLCDPALARRWVEEAGRLGVPFRVALPTYSYVLSFDAADSGGAFRGILAEGELGSMEAGRRYRVLGADAAAMAGLVQAWTADRPMNMIGIAWFRLPVAGDALNWPRETLAAVSEGREPRRELLAEARRDASGLVEIEVVNAGETAEALGGVRVAVTTSHGRVLARDALAGFAWWDEQTLAADDGAVSSILGQALRPGERVTVAWMRGQTDMEVQAHVEEKRR